MREDGYVITSFALDLLDSSVADHLQDEACRNMILIFKADPCRYATGI
jgi:hypothetical protein